MDNWAKVGSGFGLTFRPGWFPLFRLDYMFTPEENRWSCDSMSVISGDASDHSALLGQFQLIDPFEHGIVDGGLAYQNPSSD